MTFERYFTLKSQEWVEECTFTLSWARKHEAMLLRDVANVLRCWRPGDSIFFQAMETLTLLVKEYEALQSTSKDDEKAHTEFLKHLVLSAHLLIFAEGGFDRSLNTGSRCQFLVRAFLVFMKPSDSSPARSSATTTTSEVKAQ
jgi:hypothetical protein